MLPRELHIKETSRQSIYGAVARAVAFEELGLLHQCEMCGKKGRVEVHHINKDRMDNSRENLKILCRKCHNKQHDVIKSKNLPDAKVIYAEYSKEGSTLATVGKIFGLSPSCIARILEDAGFDRKKQGTSKNKNNAVKWFSQ